MSNDLNALAKHMPSHTRIKTMAAKRLSDPLETTLATYIKNTAKDAAQIANQPHISPKIAYAGFVFLLHNNADMTRIDAAIIYIETRLINTLICGTEVFSGQSGLNNAYAPAIKITKAV